MGDGGVLTTSARQRRLGVTVQYATGSRASPILSGCCSGGVLYGSQTKPLELSDSSNGFPGVVLSIQSW